MMIYIVCSSLSSIIESQNLMLIGESHGIRVANVINKEVIKSCLSFEVKKRRVLPPTVN